MAPLTLDEAGRALAAIVGEPFGRLDPGIAARVNPRHRGWVGQWLERQVGVLPGSAALDFVDGELKSFETRDDWTPVHGQVAVAVVDDPDTLLSRPALEDSVVGHKLARVLFAAWRKPTEDPRDWYVSAAFAFDLAGAPVVAEGLARSFDAIVRDFAADARADEEAPPARDLTYRADLLVLKNKDSRQEGRYGVSWSAEADRPIGARRLGFYLRPQFFALLAATPAEVRWRRAR